MRILIFCLVVFYSVEPRAQASTDKLNTEVLEFCDRIRSIKGAVYLDTTYASLDTTELKRMPGLDFSDALSPIRAFGMRKAEFSFRPISGKLNNIISMDSFHKKKEDRILSSAYETTNNDKVDSFLQLINRARLQSLPDEIKDLEKLFFQSSYWIKNSKDLDFSRSK